MSCHVIINDYEIGERMFYLLDQTDFENQEKLWNNDDEILTMFQDYQVFSGKTKWCELNLRHFHLMIINMLSLLNTFGSEVRSDKNSKSVTRLVFFLCSLIRTLEEKTNISIDSLYVNRISYDVVTYNYNATLDIPLDFEFAKKPPKFKVVSDDEDNSN